MIVIIQIGLLAMTNGYASSILFSLAPKEVPKKLIDKSGSTMSFFLTFGIAIGAFFALEVTSNILI
jgi:hypothetical protein